MMDLHYFREALLYDAGTGIFIWSEDRPRHHYASDKAWRMYKAKNAGRVAGSKNTQGYMMAKFPGRIVALHRVGFAMAKNIEVCDLPDQIDHIDNDRSNNRIVNLRPATSNQNMHNMGLNSNNTSGFKGVSWKKSEQKWVAKIKLNGKDLHIGYFSNPKDASDARAAAALRLHGEFARHATYLDGVAA